jgi:hypothetical protein
MLQMQATYVGGSHEHCNRLSRIEFGKSSGRDPCPLRLSNVKANVESLPPVNDSADFILVPLPQICSDCQCA